MLGGKLHNPAATLGPEGPPARVLEGRDHVEERRARPARKLLGERVDVDALVVLRDGDDLGAQRVQDLQRPVVGRRLHQDALPVSREQLGQEDEALERSVRDDDPSGLDAVSLGDPCP